MLAIKKTMPDYFTVLLESGVVHVDGVDQLVKILERTLDITIYSSTEEQEEYDKIEKDVDFAIRAVEELKRKMALIKAKKDNS